MRDRLWMKGLVFVIIGLFIGTSFFPVITGQTEKIEQSTENETLQSIDIDEHDYTKTFSANDNALKYVFDEPKLDQYQNMTDIDSSSPFGVLPPNDEIKLAQSFKPSYPILSKIEILLTKTINVNPVELSVKESLNTSETLLTIDITNQGISNYPTWTTVDFPDINITAQNTYYIICSTPASALIYNWHFGGNNYERGVAYLYENGIWSLADLQEYDFCFKTYGTQIDQKPVANFNWTPENPKINQTITFNASASYDPDGEIILYKWDWDNDGTYDESYPTPFATHSWTESDSYPVTLQVLDNTSLSSNITKNVNIYDIIVPDDYQTIQEAIDNSQIDYGIYVRPGGTYKENININIEQIHLQGGNSLNTTIDGQSKGHVINILEKSDLIEISGFTIKNSGRGSAGINILSPYNNIHDNNMIENGFGVHIQDSSSNQIIGNHFQNNGDAISIHNESFASFISNNTIIQNQQNGIYIDNQSDGHIIEHNTIVENTCGIKINGVSKVTIVRENIISNNNIGVDCVYHSDANRFFYNTLKENNVNAFDASYNRWDNNAIGNYWDDYTGVDTNGDGIGDTPYLIPGGENKDRYPLMYPWGPPTTPISPTGPIDGKQGKNYEYSTISTDPDGDPIKYGWDWNGDNIVEDEDWTPYYPSGEKGSVTHEFTRGEHQVQVIAKDSHNQLSGWSKPINVSITRSVIYDALFVTKNVKYHSLLSIIISRFKTWGDRVAAYGCGKPYIVEKKQPLVSSADSREIYVPDNYPTIQKAIDNSTDSDIIWVRPGIYREHLVVDKKLTIKGLNKTMRDQTIIDGGNAARDIIKIQSNNVTIQNFTLQNCKTGNCGIQINSNYTTISNNTIIKCGLGIAIYYIMYTTQRNMVTSNLIFNNTDGGIMCSDSIDCRIVNNTIGYNQDGVELSQTLHQFDRTRGTRLEKNVIYKNKNDGIYITNANDMLIGNNTINENLGRGIEISRGISIRFLHNFFVRNTKNSVSLCYSQGNTFSFNQITYESSSFLAPGKNVYIVFNSSTNLFHHNTFKNRLFYINVYDECKNTYNTETEGNYWSDYYGKDTNPRDGIGDTPYLIPGRKNKDNKDYKPLMSPPVL